ncbi:cytochrome P450 [Periconia macrospinosa]|uniref:Cytochrome P450 n=1 Tax=Periconia macrospinosa TaxID=97972 RepID=A0A2V1DAJ5_9PLEO|nr:cytochrome P450 [Periconia macrospinosa]
MRDFNFFFIKGLLISLCALVVFLFSLFFLVFAHYTSKVCTNARTLSALPWAGLQNEFFSTLRACLRDWTSGLQVVSNGYYRYGKKGQFFVTPTWWGQPLVTVPQSQFQWWSKELEPKTQLPQTVNNLQSQRIALPGLPIGEHLYYQNLQNLKKFGPRHILSWVVPSFKTYLDIGTEWTTVNIKDEAVYGPAKGTMIRAYYGETLSQNPEFIRHTMNYVRAFNGMDYRVAHFFPPWFSPIFWWVVGNRPNGPLRNQEKYDKIIIPYLRERLADIAVKKGQIEETDLLSIYLKAAYKTNDPVDLDPVVIAGRFLMLTSGFTVATLSGVLHLVMNQLTANPSYIGILLKELEATTISRPGEWDAKLLHSLVHLDSIFRESMRYSKFNGFGLALMRVVTDPNGIKLPGDNPVLVPQGTWFGAPADVIHFDNCYYEDADQFKPWRFVSTDSEDRAERNMMTALSDSNLVFGRGRNACPGRFFASDFLKTYICYFITHYDIRQVPGPNANDNPTHMQIRSRKVPTWWSSE